LGVHGSEILVGVLVATVRGAGDPQGPTALGLLVPERRRPQGGRRRESRPFHPVVGADL